LISYRCIGSFRAPLNRERASIALVSIIRILTLECGLSSLWTSWQIVHGRIRDELLFMLEVDAHEPYPANFISPRTIIFGNPFVGSAMVMRFLLT